VTSAGNQKEDTEATCALNDLAVRKDCVRTRTQREPIAHSIKVSNRRCLGIHLRRLKVRGSVIRKQENLLSN